MTTTMINQSACSSRKDDLYPALKGTLTRAAYRALLGREPEPGIPFANEPSAFSPEQDGELEDLLRQMIASAEFIGRLPERQEYSPNTWVLASIYPDLKMWIDLGDLGVCRPALRRDYEPAETRFVDGFLRPGQHFADIGANVGWFALRAAKAVGPTGRVIAFEPRHLTSRHLEMSAEANGFQDRMTIHAFALGSEDGEMHIGYSADGVNAGGTWSLPTKELVDVYQQNGHIVQPTAVKRFDDVIGDTRIDLIKIDIEGAEMMALSGATGVIQRDKPTILAEINPDCLRQVSQVSGDDLVNLIRSFGYDGFYLTEDGIGGRIGEHVELPEGKGMTNVVFKAIA